jgi:hypothetical protein
MTTRQLPRRSVPSRRRRAFSCATVLRMAEHPPKRVKRESSAGVRTFVLGQRVRIPSKGDGKGVVRFVGETTFCDGTFVGIEFDEPVGKHGGTVDGTTYFECTAPHGIMTTPQNVELANVDLSDFPLLKSLVLAPREDHHTAREYTKVLRHIRGQEPKLVVQPEGDTLESTIALTTINAMQRSGFCVVQYLEARQTGGVKLDGKSPAATSRVKMLQVETEVKPKLEINSEELPNITPRKLFTRKQITEVIGGNFMQAPWVPTKTGKGPRRPASEAALLRPGETYVVETPGSNWSPHQPSAAGQHGALRHWNADELRHLIRNGEAQHASGALDIIDPQNGPPVSFEFFAGRAPALYEYCGRYVMQAYDEECMFEDPASFSKERVAALVQSYKTDGVRAASSDEEATAWVMDSANWKLRIIKPVADGYNEELYQRLASL